MYTQPVRRRAPYGLAGAHDRQVPADRHCGTYEDFLRRHELEAKQAARGTKREREEFAQCLLQRAGDTRNVIVAIEHCVSHGQAAGPDGLRPRDLDRQAIREMATTLSNLIQDGTYQPSAPRQKWIDKGCGRGQRPIQIQNLTDRAVERAVLQVTRPLTQSGYLDMSFGFRYPSRTREEALLKAEQLATEQNCWVWISQDLRDAFENISRSRLMQLVRKMLNANPICEFIERIASKPNKRGVRQGGPLSPELLNIYLHWMLDIWWQRNLPQVPMLRVADDLLILASTSEEATELHQRLAARGQEIGMPLKYREEAAIQDMQARKTTNWLGYRVARTGTGIQTEIAEKSWAKLEEHLQLTWEEPHPMLRARDTILGWIGQQGAAYQKDLVQRTYTGITRRALQYGFDEIPPKEEIASVWHQAHLRDWVNRRTYLHTAGVTTTELAEGFAAQHFPTPACSGRSDEVRPTDVPPQQVPARRKVYLYCDGACLSPHGHGGWAYLIIEPETGWQDAVPDSARRTTNNRMELMAVIRGLASLPAPAEVRLVVDSEYVHRGITEWLPGWKRQGWRAGRKRPRPLKNLDLWQQLDAELQRHAVFSRWVRGHSGHPQNEFVDRLAHEAAQHIRNTDGGALPTH